MIKYQSTRGSSNAKTAAQAVIQGIAEDKGLYVPDSVPALPKKISEFVGMPYKEVARDIIKAFFTDYTDEEMQHCVDGAYDTKFEEKEIVPVKEAGGAYFLELYHGKTAAFKDMALSILPYLLTTAMKKENEDKKICILTATSGDTGKAALEGFADVPGTEIIVFFPNQGVSEVQERQMITQEGANTHVFAIEGNFDDAQTGVKKIFNDADFAKKLAEHGCKLSSANSINIGRLVPQVVYYVYAYGQMLQAGDAAEGEKIDVCVPTGNFGNILAAYLAKHMGVPIEKLICASNENKVLTDFFGTGEYNRNRPFILTSSPSMDILISSNLERLIYLSTGCNSVKTAQLMEDLRTKGVYEVSEDMRQFMADFVGGFAEEPEVFKTIRDLKEEAGYVLDPHTAVASAVYKQYAEKTGDTRKTVVASTASPYKFAPNVMKALGYDVEHQDVFEVIDQLSEISGVPEPRAIREVRNAAIRHSEVCEISEMKKMVEDFLFV